ncbi:NAD(P)H-binding protein [Glycomyces buryatensis]|uniref:NAD-dependent epimerase/dehydratase family protein n=1 Tax=Glycomyces buryatensis TaxID=2570927 RepID=A0A4S8Q749_9ACTN|nr:NAD(P)H-binding protein [Glycomyces buryatensis]THV40133.1 NAD-dependent epimerase/dehydratase family protein [Glycomyces buryatensis]
MNILVTAATGNVGRHLVNELVSSGHRVRALTRDPDSADLPDGVEAVAGDFTDLASLEAALKGVDALHLITTYGPSNETLPNGPELAELVRQAGVRRVTLLWNGYRGPVEEAFETAGLRPTELQPGEFMSNALTWAEEVRNSGVVREANAHIRQTQVHEADIAAVAAVALTSDGHEGKAYPLTGPEPLNPAERVAILAEAAGRPIRFEALTDAQARERMRDLGHEDAVVDYVLGWQSDPPEAFRIVSDAVEVVTGRPARAFAQWAEAHAADFR